MNSRERIKRYIKSREKLDLIPWTIGFGATHGMNPNLLNNYKKSRNINKSIYDYFDFDIRIVFDPETFSEKRPGDAALAGYPFFIKNNIKKEEYYKDINKDGYLDHNGVLHVPWPEDPTFEEYYSPLAKINENEALYHIENYPMPRINKSKLKLARKEINKIKQNNKMSVFWGGSLFEDVTQIRGTEQFFLDLYLNPKAAYKIIEKSMDVTLEIATEVAKIGVDIISFYDDWGSQKALQISPAMWCKFFKKPWKEIINAVKKINNEIIIFIHSCGNIEEIMSEVIECGFEIVHPIQPEAMNVHKIVNEYKKYICFWGTISAQETMPFGSKEKIENEIKDRIDLVKNGARIIISPSNILGPEVPLQNIDYFINSCKEFCKF